MVIMKQKIKQKIHILGLFVFCILTVTLFLYPKLTGAPMSTPSNTTLTLYYSPSCPYCVKVVDFMENEGITLEKRNTQDPAIKAELIDIGGKGQVPCLVHNGKALYESADIINWLAQNEINPQKDLLDE